MLVSSVKATTVKDRETGIQSIELDESWSFLQSLPIAWEQEMVGMPEWKILELIREDCIKNKKPLSKRFVTWKQSVEKRNVIRQFRLSRHEPTIDQSSGYYDQYN